MFAFALHLSGTWETVADRGDLHLAVVVGAATAPHALSTRSSLVPKVSSPTSGPKARGVVVLLLLKLLNYFSRLLDAGYSVKLAGEHIYVVTS